MTNVPAHLEALFDVAIEAESEAARSKLVEALTHMTADDPGVSAHLDSAAGQAILSGQDRTLLASRLDSLRRAAGPDIAVGTFQVAYRESLKRPTEISFTHSKRHGDAGQYAHVRILFEPGPPGSGFQFQANTTGGHIPEQFIKGVEQGLAQARETGWISGFPVIRVKATLIDGKYHGPESSVLAFQVAAKCAFRALRNKGYPILLEPVIKADISTPGECVGAIMSDLGTRRAQVQTTQLSDCGLIVTALAPLANMLDYTEALQKLTDGKARFAMRYHGHEERARPTPPDDFLPPANALRA